MKKLSLLLAISLLSFNSVSADKKTPAPTAKPELDAPSNATQQLPLSELRIFAEVLERIRATYVEPVEDKELLENAIVGMLQELDPHSSFLRPSDFEDLRVSTTGEFGGLGIEVGMEDGFVKVISPIEGTPAEKAGVQPGDLIVKLNDTPVKGLSLNDAVEIMRGPIGSDIELLIIREGASKPLEITITRAKIVVKSVRHEIFEENYAYLRISQFQSHTGTDVEAAIKKLQKDRTLQGFVLDLRNNPGGVLTGAAHVSDVFLQSGKIVYTEGRVADANSVFMAEELVIGDSINNIPMVVLVNGGSASASEIVAGALQDHSRAIIMGTKTFGKGSVQTILPLHNNYALKLTTARYFTPNGRSIQAEGIKPDIIVEPAQVKKLSLRKGISEANLKGHLEKNNKKKTKKANEASSETLEQQDYQLAQAIQLLKGIHISSSIGKNNASK